MLFACFKIHEINFRTHPNRPGRTYRATEVLLAEVRREFYRKRGIGNTPPLEFCGKCLVSRIFEIDSQSLRGRFGCLFFRSDLV